MEGVQPEMDDQQECVVFHTYNNPENVDTIVTGVSPRAFTSRYVSHASAAITFPDSGTARRVIDNPAPVYDMTTPSSSPPRNLKRKRDCNKVVEKYLLQKLVRDEVWNRRQLEIEKQKLALDEKRLELERRRLELQAERDEQFTSYMRDMMERQEAKDKKFLEVMSAFVEFINKKSRV